MDTREKLVDTLRKFDTVMVGTPAENGTIHARPMAVADVDPGGVVWFVSGEDTPKLDEIRADGRAVLTGQQTGLYVSVSGHIDVVHDRERIHALWKPSWKVWFPEGPDDASVVLMRFAPEIGEFWDNTGSRGIRYVFEAARALVNGQRPASDAEQHAKVPM